VPSQADHGRKDRSTCIAIRNLLLSEVSVLLIRERLEECAMQLARVVQLSLLLLGSFGLEACANGPIVRTQNGEVRGVAQGQAESFKALPYAAPPIGPLRWMPSQEPENWTGIRDASNFSAQCPQTDEGKFVGNEDCLYLNVFRPVGARALPVIVFIHGGANVTGSAGRKRYDLYLYDGSQLAQKNVIVVTLNYRLGTLGFVGHPKLSKSSGYGGSGNYGYMDQIQALKWVQRNITAFGGDPSNVTLFGQSAGGKSVWVHLTSPLSAGLFHRAVVHSAVREGAKELRDAEQVGLDLSQKLNCSTAADELACMRGKSAEQVVGALPSVRGTGLYAGVVDGKVLTGAPIEIMRRGLHHHVPILQGNVEEEVSWLREDVSNAIRTEEEYVRAVENLVATSIPDGSAPELLRRYPGSDYRSLAKAYNAIVTDREYLCPSRRVLRALSHSQTEFVGRFLYTHPYSSGPLVKYGASHGYELLFIFDTLKGARVYPTGDELALVKTFQDIWSGFARTGAPPAYWTRYDRQRDNHRIFDSKLLEREHLRSQHCDYWDTLRAP
jgi:para-nitrobenzyl esterase